MMRAQAGIQESSLGIVVTRADGTVEDLGIVAYYHNNPIKLLIWQLKKFIKHLGE